MFILLILIEIDVRHLVKRRLAGGGPAVPRCLRERLAAHFPTTTTWFYLAIATALSATAVPGLTAATSAYNTRGET